MSEPTVITSATKDILASVDLVEPERFKFIGMLLKSPATISGLGALDETVEGWILPPLGLDKARKYPTVMLVHGGYVVLAFNCLDLD